MFSFSAFVSSFALLFCFFFFNDTATTEIYTLSLHDALPISARAWGDGAAFCFPSPDSATSSQDRKSTRLNSSHITISYAVFCLKKKKKEFFLYRGRDRGVHLAAIGERRPPTHSARDVPASRDAVVAACAECFRGGLFFFNDTATTEIYTLSLHDALPI